MGAIAERHEQLRRRVKLVCDDLLRRRVPPTGQALRAAIPEHRLPLLLQMRDELVEREEVRFALWWPAWTDEHTWELGRKQVRRPHCRNSQLATGNSQLPGTRALP